MSLFDRIQKRILNEEDKRDSNRKRYNQVEKELQQARREERKREKKFGPENPEGKVKFNKNTNQNTQNPSSGTGTPKRNSITFTPGGQGTLPDFDPETGKIVTDQQGKPLFGKEPPKAKRVKTTYNKKTKTQTPIETSGPLFDQQPTKKGFKSFVKSPAYYAKQREKTKAGRNRYDFIPDKEGKFDFNPKTKKSNIEKYARRMLSRKQIDSKSNVPIELTSDDLAKAERDARSKYGGRDGKQMTQSQRNKVLTKIKNQPKAKTMTYLSPAGSGKPVPLKTRRIRKKIKTNTNTKPVKQFDGKSFDDFIRDAEKKSKKALQDVKNIKVEPVTKIGSKVSVGNQIPYVSPPPLKDPTKGLKFKKARAIVPKNKTLRAIQRAARKNPRLALGATILGTIGTIAVGNRLRNPKSGIGAGGTGKKDPLVANVKATYFLDPKKTQFSVDTSNDPSKPNYKVIKNPKFPK